MTANEKYLVREYENFLTQLQMQLSWKLRIFSDFLVPFLETTWNYEHLQKKMIFIPALFRKLQTVKDLVRPLSKKHRFRTPFDSQHVKGSQTLVKSSWEHFHYIVHHSERACFGIYLPQWYLKSEGCLVTYWLPMRSILFENMRICWPRFKCFDLEN